MPKKITAPSVTNVRVLLTTKWGKNGYRPIVVREIESYYVDTALDNDADGWQLEIGDPNGNLLEVLERDNEVRVQLYGYSAKGSDYIMTGIADNISYDEEGTLAITGRDLSSIATDTIVPPSQMRHARAHSIVKKQATRLGFQRMSLASANQSFKRQYTDGSESYWEFWYRLYRKEKKWIWTEPDGTLIASGLNYEGSPSYYFGVPKQGELAKIRSQYLPIEHIAFSKDTTKRVEEVWVYGHHGDNGFRQVERDPHMKQWLKRPLKILLDTDAITPTQATKLAWEEIFEGKVGELEMRVTLPDPGYEIRQNKIAVVRVPEIDYANTMFIVGVRRAGGRDGAVLEVRLRERNYAISRRVPKDPKIAQDPAKDVSTELGNQLPGITGSREEWGNFFVASAKKHHGPQDFTFFLAVLLAICDQETSFKNYRRFGGPGGDRIEWYPWSNQHGSEFPNRPAPPGPGRDEHGRTLEEWRTLFANEKGQYVTEDYAVGPMQLLSTVYKVYADNLLRAGFHDQWNGGRWYPEFNIDGGGFALRDKLKGVTGDSARESDMWAAVGAYGEGASYAQSVKSKVYNTYLPQVQEALKAAKDAADAARDGQTDPSTDPGDFPEGLPTANQVQAFYATYQPSVAHDFQKRQAVQYAAMWGYYNRDSIDYTQGASRDKIQIGVPGIPRATDCSGFVTWCFWSAGMPDPSFPGGRYANIGNTSTLWHHGKPVTFAAARPGDLIFYRNPDSRNSHAVVYVGNGMCVSHGQSAGPLLERMTQPGSITGWRTYPT